MDLRLFKIPREPLDGSEMFSTLFFQPRSCLTFLFVYPTNQMIAWSSSLAAAAKTPEMFVPACDLSLDGGSSAVCSGTAFHPEKFNVRASFKYAIGDVKLPVALGTSVLFCLSQLFKTDR